MLYPKASSTFIQGYLTGSSNDDWKTYVLWMVEWQ